MGCFCFEEEPPEVERGSKGEALYRYPSGNVAAVVAPEKSSFYDDAKYGKLLCSFDKQGVGNVYYETGRPRVTVTESDCTFFDAEGAVRKKWTWPRLLKEREEVRLGERINVTLIDRNNIAVKLKLSATGKTTEFPCGHVAKK